MPTLTMVKNALEGMKKDLLAEGKFRRSFYERTMYPLYQKKQSERFATEGASEEQSTDWKISNKWREEKVRRRDRNPEKYPGGDRSGIYTGAFMGGAVGVGNWKKLHRKAITDKAMVLSTTRENFKWINQKFKITEWSQKTKKEFKQKMSRYFVEFLTSMRKRK